MLSTVVTTIVHGTVFLRKFPPNRKQPSAFYSPSSVHYGDSFYYMALLNHSFNAISIHLGFNCLCLSWLTMCFPPNTLGILAWRTGILLHSCFEPLCVGAIFFRSRTICTWHSKWIHGLGNIKEQIALFYKWTRRFTSYFWAFFQS